MERIFAGEIYEVVPQPNGIVFSYCKSSDEDRVLVAYKMLSLDNGMLTDVAKNIYLLSKFGSNYRAAAANCGNYVTAKAIVMPNGRAFACSDSGDTVIIDGDGELLYKGELCYRNQPPADIAAYGNSLWACYARQGVLLRFNMSTMREELRIGGINSPFDKPNDIFIDGSTAVVSCIGSNKLIKVDLNSYTVSDFKEFSEPVYSYVKIREYDFVLMESGLYVI